MYISLSDTERKKLHDPLCFINRSEPRCLQVISALDTSLDWRDQDRDRNGILGILTSKPDYELVTRISTS